MVLSDSPSQPFILLRQLDQRFLSELLLEGLHSMKKIARDELKGVASYSPIRGEGVHEEPFETPEGEKYN